jgi:mannosyltransferase PIG-V
MTRIRQSITQYWKKLSASWRFAILAFTIAQLFYAAWAWVIFVIEPVAIQNFAFGDEQVVTIFRLSNSEAYIYLRDVGGDMLTFRPVDAHSMTDEQTGTIWNISGGEGISGRYTGEVLSKSRAPITDIFPYHGTMPFPNIQLAMWQRFDANWYSSIAEHGYGWIPGDDHFPPLYPLLIRILLPIFGDVFSAGLFSSRMATFFLVKLLYDFFEQHCPPQIAERAAVLYLLYPASFFLFSAYSEPVFLVFVLLALRSMNSHLWSWAGFWTFCAISTRLQGTALLAPMIYLMWKEGFLLRKPAHWFGLGIACLSGLFYLYLRSVQVAGDAVPLVEAEWHARLVPPWETYLYAVKTIFSGQATFIDVLNWGMVTLFVILFVWGWRKIPLEYDLYVAFTLLIILIRIVETQPLISASRYMLALFPSFYSLSLAAENAILRRIIIYTFIPLNLYLSGQFFLWGWVA